MKKLIFCLLLSLSVISISAQEKGKIRVGGNLGLTIPAAGAGLSIDLLDIRYNILDNLNVGVKFGGAYMLRDLSTNENQTSAEVTMHVNSNFMLVGDYYFNNGTSVFAPFVGGGIGSFGIYDIYMQAEEDTEFNYTINEFPSPSRTLGGALRAGFELGKFRMALEYYIIPQTPKYNVASIMQPAGNSGNSYLSLNLGFYFGGGKWNKN